MNNTSNAHLSTRTSVLFQTGQGGLPMLVVQTPASEAHIYLHGAQVTHFQRRGERPVLFMSAQSLFAEGKAIRGGIPVILPWFGPRAGQPLHGFARLHAWQVGEIQTLPGNEARVLLHLPACPEAAEWPRFEATCAITVGEELGVELSVNNTDPARALDLQTCLHTYFAVADIAQVEVRGLKGVSYLDALEGMAPKVQIEDPIRFTSEVDRVYENSPHAVEITDLAWQRIIRVEKEQSHSTVVWNPWIAKAQRMPDFGDDEYRRMVCVESGNVWQNSLTLASGATAMMRVRLSTRPA
jgi:D-hexose-6-phosphate mutarotase